MSTLSDGLHNYARFTGRSARRPTWTFLIAFSLGNYLLVNATKLAVHMTGASSPTSIIVASVSALFFAFTIMPMAAVMARRLQDTGRPGAWTLLPTGAVTFISVSERLVIGQGYAPLIPVFIGAAPIVIWFLVWAMQPGETAPNRYGPPPT